MLKALPKALYKYRQRSNRTIDSQILDVQVIDIYEGYSRVGQAGNNKLKTVVKYEELVEEVVSAEYEVKWWGTDNTKLCYYNWMDSVYVELVDNKKKIFEFYWGLRRAAGLPYIEDVFYNSRIIDTLLMRMLKGKYVLPSKKEEEKLEAFAGAVVYEPKPGFYTKGIGIMDFSRAYPTFMIKHNLSPEVFQLGLKEEGCLPALCRVLMAERDKHEAVMEEIFQCDGPECDEYKTAKLKRDQVKFLLNAVYGVVGSPYFRIYMKEVSATVTRIGREALGQIKEKAQSMDIDVIYGDTDSVFLEVDSPEEGERVAEVLEQHVNEWFDKLVVDDVYIQEAAMA
jgi:DNA polymerase elongation subunit (family B)